MVQNFHRLFGDTLVAVCNEDSGRVEHGVVCLALTADARAVWCVGGVDASCVDLSSMRIIACVEFDSGASEGPTAAHATSEDPESVTVVFGNGAVMTLTGEQLGTVGHSVGAAVFSRDGKTLATLPSPGDTTEEISVWSMTPPRRIRAFAGVAPMDLSDAGTTVAHGVAGSKGLGVAFTRVADGVTVRRSFDPSLRSVALTGETTAFVVAEQRMLRVPMDPAEAIEHIRAGTDGWRMVLHRNASHCIKTLSAVQSFNLQVSRDDGASLTLDTLSMAHPRIAALPDARGFVAVSADGGAVVRGDLAQGTLTASSGGHDLITDIAWSPDGRAIASVARDGTCVVWDAATGAARTRIEGPRSGLELELAWCPDGRAIVVVEQSGVVACWNVHDSTPAWRIGVRPPHPLESPSKWRAVVSPDGEFLAVRSSTLRVYRVGDPAPILERTDAAYFAWHADHPAVLVTVTRPATPGTRWETLDLRDAKPLASGAVRAQIATLALDGRHLWFQASLTTPGDGLTALAIDPIAPQWLSFHRSVRGMITAHGGALLANAVGRSTWVVRVDGSARPVPSSIDTFPRRALSPDGTRLAVVRNGRIAIVALP